ncbi:MAG: MOSC domain-containing protein [Acidobacteria bacterium]|nr:MOSC domain-containing protein [Acidobacteriota bacterium]
MKLISVNVATPREVSHEGKPVRTGIFKEPVRGRVRLGTMNLAGDSQAAREVHGGIHKAVYVYTLENYEYWKRELGRDELPHGQFGENFTVEGMSEGEVHVGDVFRVGGAMVEVTQPRQPCFKLGIRIGMAEFPRMFLRSGRVGFYLRVLIEGEVGAGDRIERLKVDPRRMTVARIHALFNFNRQNVEGARKAIGIPALSPDWREAFQRIVEEADRNPRGNIGCCNLPT